MFIPEDFIDISSNQLLVIVISLRKVEFALLIGELLWIVLALLKLLNRVSDCTSLCFEPKLLCGGLCCSLLLLKSFILEVVAAHFLVAF